MKKTILIFGLAFIFLLGKQSAHAALLTIHDQIFSVDAMNHRYLNPLSTGLLIQPGDTLTFSAGWDDTWILYDQFPLEYTTNANGLTSQASIKNSEISFYAGTLVGKIGDAGKHFKIGTFQSLSTSDHGELYLLCWDKLDRYENNLGTIDVSVIVQRETPVPEPATLILFGSGLAGLAGVNRRRKNARDQKP